MSNATGVIAPPTPPMAHTLHLMCGPRYNAFVPARNSSDEACRFFRISARPVTWRRVVVDLPQESNAAVDEEVERWDGMA